MLGATVGRGVEVGVAVTTKGVCVGWGVAVLGATVERTRRRHRAAGQKLVAGGYNLAHARPLEVSAGSLNARRSLEKGRRCGAARRLRSSPFYGGGVGQGHEGVPSAD